MFLGLLLFGSFWFWTVTVAAVIAIACAVENDHPGWATLTLIGTFVALGCLGDVNVLHFALHNPIETLCYGLGYVACGLVWAYIKWKNYAARSAASFEDNKRVWLAGQSRSVKNPKYNASVNDWREREFGYEPVPVSKTGPVVIPEDFQEAWLDYARTLIPTFKGSFARLVAWATYWPTSLAWALLRDWVLKLFESVILRAKRFFVGARNRAFAEVLKDMPADFKLDD